MAKQKLTNVNFDKLVLRLKSDIKNSKKFENEHRKERNYNQAEYEVNNQENFIYFLDLLRQARQNKWD